MAAARSTTGSIDVPHLRALWRRNVAPEQPAAPVDAASWAADRAVIDGLGLGLHETLHFLHFATPSFAAFKHWVLDHHGGAIEPAVAASVNAAVARMLGEAPAPVKSGFPPGFEPVLDQEDLRCWDERGYVLLRGAVSRDAAAEAAAAVWEFLGMHPEEPRSWCDRSHTEGIFIPLVHHPALVRNRRSPRIRAAFAQLCGTSELQVNADRAGFNPPQQPDFAYRPPGLHWDTSLVPPIPAEPHGILYLTDTPAEQGAFCCVPGFHRSIETWLAGLAPDVDARVAILSHPAQRIGGGAGDMVIWHAALPHGASRNEGPRPRLAQYIAYRPANVPDDRPWR
ncbi:MAG TPA: phytanoyl-CoA dioxygenase family protein [Stellaceae bacterium]|jgi:hypothetical protein|nr:phytanoyl-CoA dioxygenase family protein [Stellaceae bacterium]